MQDDYEEIEIAFESELLEQIREAADAKGVSVEQYICNAIYRYIEKYLTQ